MATTVSMTKANNINNLITKNKALHSLVTPVRAPSKKTKVKAQEEEEEEEEAPAEGRKLSRLQSSKMQIGRALRNPKRDRVFRQGKVVKIVKELLDEQGRDRAENRISKKAYTIIGYALDRYADMLILGAVKNNSHAKSKLGANIKSVNVIEALNRLSAHSGLFESSIDDISLEFSRFAQAAPADA